MSDAIICGRGCQKEYSGRIYRRRAAVRLSILVISAGMVAVEVEREPDGEGHWQQTEGYAFLRSFFLNLPPLVVLEH